MLAKVGQQPDREGRRAHQQQAGDQHLLAADLVAVVAEDDAAQRAGEEPDREGGEGEQGGGGGLAAGEEQRPEHQGGGRPVEEEVVPFHGGADHAGERDLDDRGSPAGAGSRLAGYIGSGHCCVLSELLGRHGVVTVKE